MRSLLAGLAVLFSAAYAHSDPLACAWPNCGTYPPKSSASPIDVSLQDCTAGGVCPNPRGAFVIDQWVGWGGAQGQNRDTDGSMWSSATANDASEDDYWPIAIGDYTGCAASTTALTLRNGSPIATTTSDRIQMAIPDGTHGDVYYHRWLAQLVQNASEEFAFYPAVNAIANGQAESDCSVASWTETGTGTVSTIAQVVRNASGSPRSLHGAGCQLGSRGAAADSLNTPQFATLPNTVYVAKGWVANNSASSTITVEVFDQTPTVLATSSVVAWHILGANPISWASETGSAAECYGGCFVVVKFRSGSAQTGATIRVRTSGTEAITMDEWFAFPSPTQNLSLNPLIKDGLVSMRLESDSRSDGITSNEFATAFDAMLASTRPNLALTQPLASRRSAVSGRTLEDIVSESYSTIRGSVSDYTLIYLGVNDAVQDRTPAQYAADMLATVREVRKAGSIPIILTDPPYRGDTDSNVCGTGGATNCALTLSDYVRLVTGDPDLY